MFHFHTKTAMKKSSFLCALLLAFTGMQAQTITSLIAPTAGTNYGYMLDTLPLSPGAAGASQIWNFSNISFSSGMGMETCVSPATTPAASSFPNATVAMGTIGDTSFNYFIVSTASSQLIGITDGSRVIPFSDPATDLTFPMSLNSTVNDAYTGLFNISFSGLAVPVTVSGNVNTLADAAGTLLLPSVLPLTGLLRVHTRFTQNVSASLFGAPTPISNTITHTWRWYDPASRFPVFQISIDSIQTFAVSLINQPASNVVMHKTKMRSSTAVGFSTPDADNGFSLFPNPSPGMTTMMYEGKLDEARLIICNLAGMEVKNQLLGRVTGQQQLQIDASDYAPGLYLVKLVSGNTCKTHKLIVE
jgi:hypothetical protein